MKKAQNFQNHIRLVRGWHFYTFGLLLLTLIGSFVNLFHAAPEVHYSAALICCILLLLGAFFWYIRLFALKAQDRAIRAEENFRHYLLTGKPLPAGLRLSQIIALRFASDAELPALADKAVQEKLSNKQIKQAIQEWRPDYNRV
jgi:hypothetical protein